MKKNIAKSLLVLVFAFLPLILPAKMFTFTPDGDLNASKKIVPRIDGSRGVAGFSFALEFTCPSEFNGVIAEKPGVFRFSISGKPENRFYTVDFYGEISGSSRKMVSLTGSAETDPDQPVRVAVVGDFYNQSEQSRVGHRGAIYVNGEKSISKNFSWFFFKADRREALKINPEFPGKIKEIVLGDEAHSTADLFPAEKQMKSTVFGDSPQAVWAGVVFSRWERTGVSADRKAGLEKFFKSAVGGSIEKWNDGQSEIRFICSKDLAVAVSCRPGTGSALLGVFDRKHQLNIGKDDVFSWEVVFLADDGRNMRLYATSRYVKSEASFTGENSFFIKSSGMGFEVINDFTLTGKRLEGRMRVRDLRADRLQNVVFPRFKFNKLPGGDHLVEPQFSGRVANDPTRSYHYGANYPEDNMTMQFCGYYNEAGQGIYAAIEDPLCRTKRYTADGMQGVLQLDFSETVAFSSGKNGGKNYETSGVAAMEVYDGQWFESGQVYKKFLKKCPWYIKELPRKDHPEWFAASPFWIQQPDPTPSVLPTYKFLQDYFEVPVAFIVGTMTALPGAHYGPDYIIREDALACIEEMHRYGVRLLPYTNPRLWFAGKDADKFNNYETIGKHYATNKPDGTPYIEMYGPFPYAVPCPAVPAWQQRLLKRTMEIAASGMDGIYHDQMPCCTPYTCYNDHGHPKADPEAWISKGHWPLCDLFMKDMRKKYPDFMHCGEEISEPFVNSMDGAVVWRFGRSSHVPLFQSLFSARIQMMARGCDVHERSGDYQSFFPRFAEQLVYGEQVGWVALKSLRYPSPRRVFLKKLAHLRYVLAPYFNSSEMLAPLKFREKPETITGEWGVYDTNINTTDKILHSVWQNVNNQRIMLVFVNTVNEVQRLKPVFPFGKGVYTLCSEREKEIVCFKDKAPEVIELGAYEMAVCFFDRTAPAPEAEKVMPVIRKISTFAAEDEGMVLNQPKFSDGGELSLAGGKFLYARDSVWRLFATMEESSGFNYRKNPAYGMTENWVAAQDGSIIYYGSVDFGKKPAANLECLLATDRKGVKVQLIDITGDCPQRVLAEFKPEPGEWFEFRRCRARLKEPVSGKRKVLFKVLGDRCNFRGWRMVQREKVK